MSRIGRMPVVVPGGVDVTIEGREVTVKGPKGTLSLQVAQPISFGHKGNRGCLGRSDNDSAICLGLLRGVQPWRRESGRSSLDGGRRLRG